MPQIPKVSGFTLVRNGTWFDYPYLESLSSLLPLVDELVVNVGVGDDDTLEQVQKFAREVGEGKVRWFESRWPLDDPEKKRAGLILSEQTNLALDRCSYDWCIYLQADEVFHEEDYTSIRKSLALADADSAVDGLLFTYVHFYGSYDVVQTSRNAYRREVRAIRKSSGARSVGDAQSFRKTAASGSGEKPRVIHSGARVFHYGWVRTPEAMKTKTYFMDQLYHGDYEESGAAAPPAAGVSVEKTSASAGQPVPHTGSNYLYKRFWGLKRYRGSHPAVMRERIRRKNWQWDFENSPFTWTWKDARKVVLDTYERMTGRRPFEYRSYEVIPASGRRSR